MEEKMKKKMCLDCGAELWDELDFRCEGCAIKIFLSDKELIKLAKKLREEKNEDK